MNNIIKKLQKNKKVQQLLNEFETDFTINYENSDDVEEFIMSNYRDTTFRKWLYSPIVEDTYLTPYYIINNIAQNIQKGDYSIAPHINISIENNEVNFTTKWIKYSKEESPVLEDLNILMNYCNPTLIQREKNKFVLDDGEKIIKEINFRSGYYIEYLIDLSLKLNIIKEIKAIGCKCYQVSEAYEEFNNLDNKEKINKIIMNSIELSNEKLKSDCQINNSNIATELLDNAVSCDECIEYMSGLVKYYESNVNLINKSAMDDNDIRAIMEVEKLTGNNIATVMAAKDFSVIFDANFTHIFGYYLGIINPLYDGLFFVEVFNKSVANAIQDEAVVNVIFTLEIGHELTQFGEIIVSQIKKKLRENTLNKVNNEIINEAIDYYLYTKEETLEEYLGMFGDIDDIFDEDDDEMLNELFGENMSKVVIQHLIEFYDYLFMDRKLKENTANKHCENVELYISNYLNMKGLDDLKKITKDSIHTFMLEWFIPKVATSKSNVKDQIISLKQYVKYLTDKGFINKGLVQEFKEISKNKENYVDYFEEYMEEDWDLF